MERDDLAQIAAAPEDDGPRLVWADALLERADPRGELIKLQCDLARMRADPEDEAWNARKLRERELIAAQRHVWAPGLKELEIAAFEFRRGFVEHMTLHGSQFAQHAEKLFEIAPLFSSVTLMLRGDPRGRRQDLELFLSSPHLGRLRALEVDEASSISGEDLARIGATQALDGLVSFGLNYADVEDAELAALAASAPLKNVRSLHIRRSSVGEEAARAIAKLPLRELDLSRNPVGPAGAARLAESKALRGLRRLDLSETNAGPEGAVAIADSPHFGALQTLFLESNRIAADGASALGSSKTLERLTYLDVRSNRLGKKGGAAITNGKGLPILEELVLRDTGLADAGAIAVAQSPLARRIARLNLRENGITDTGAAAFATATGLERLRALNLNKNKLTPAGQQLLDDAEPLRGVILYKATQLR